MLRLVHVRVLLALLGFAHGARQPEQVHISLGLAPDQMTVNWITPPGEILGQGLSMVRYGLAPEQLSMTVLGYNKSFEDGGLERRRRFVHVATMKGLEPNRRYYYSVGDPDDGWSWVYTFVAAPSPEAPRLPLRFAVYGDLGDGNAQSLTRIQEEVTARTIDMVVHAGDFAYDLHYEQGAIGDRFMRSIEPIAASVPYLTCPGNHEKHYDQAHYVYRFMGQPSNSPPLPAWHFPAHMVGLPNNLFFSFDTRPVHWLAVSSEIYFYQALLVEWQYTWLEKDLAAVNRKQTPWVVLYMHRPMYCSTGEDCFEEADRLRDGPNGKFGIEDLAYKHGVDLVIVAHEHNYERMHALYRNKTVTHEVNGVLMNPKAPVHIVTGSAGNREGHEDFQLPWPPYTAARFNTFGYSRLTVHNATHLYWEQVQTDRGQPEEEMGKVIDAFWLVQHAHGPRNTEP